MYIPYRPPLLIESERLFPGLTAEHMMQPEVPVLETQIRSLERELGVYTDAERLLEAGFLIDAPFIDTPLIRGQSLRFERLFGDEEWAAYLQARLLAREYGPQSLTLDFVERLHKTFLERTQPEITESFVDSKRSVGGRLENGQVVPIILNDDQIKVIESNCFLEWQASPDDFNKGRIGYCVKTRLARMEQLQVLCETYNAVRSDPAHNPYELAACLQRIFVSIHPLSFDYNGRVSRILMNWSLENDGKAPSILDDFNADILGSEQDWIDHVTQGSWRYTRYRQQLASGETDPVVLRGVQEQRLYYLQNFMTTEEVPPPLRGGSLHNYDACKRFVDACKKRDNPTQRVLSAAVVLRQVDGKA